MKRYPKFCIYQKQLSNGKISGFWGKVTHTVGKILILCWCAFTVALIGWVIMASFTSTKDIFQNAILNGGPDFSGYELVTKRYHIMDYFLTACCIPYVPVRA